jgi:hypothetical protein
MSLVAEVAQGRDKMQMPCLAAYCMKEWFAEEVAISQEGEAAK